MKKVFLPLVLLIGIFFTSCETDVDLIGEFKESTIVYGLLNQNDSVHYVRVNKAFITSENAYDAAKIKGINEYAPDSVQVYLYEKDENGFVLDKTILDDTMWVTSTNGDFFDTSIFYFLKKHLNEESSYQIVVKPFDADSASAVTPLVNNFSINIPRPYGSANFVAAPGTSQRFEWIASKYGKKYEANINFYYKEKRTDKADSITRMVEWQVGSILVDNAENPPISDQVLAYLPQSFFVICENQIPYSDPSIESKVSGRRPLRVDYVISVAADDFNTYMEVNNTSGIVQDRSAYTNVDNGLGIFSSRYQKTITKPLSLETLLELRAKGLKFE